MTQSAWWQFSLYVSGCAPCISAQFWNKTIYRCYATLSPVDARFLRRDLKVALAGFVSDIQQTITKQEMTTRRT